MLTKQSIFANLWQPIDAVAAVASLAFLSQMLVSYGLWLPMERMYPMISLFEALPLQWGFVGDSLLFFTFLVALLATAFLSFKKISIPILGLISIFWVLQDVMRVQAWTYHYMVLLILVWAATCCPDKRLEWKQLMRWVMVGTYIWTGIHKFNLHFAESVFPWLMEIFELTKPFADVKALAYSTAVFESLLGLGLLWPRSRRPTVWVLTVFHAIILTLLIADKWNYVVYAWNIAMVLLVWILFYPKSEKPNPSLLRSWLPSYSILFLFGIAPGLQPFGLWPYDLSLTMYSGCSMDMTLGFHYSAVYEQKIWNCIPKSLVDELDTEEGDFLSINMDTWALHTMHVPTYPAEWYYRRVGKKLCACLNSEQSYIELEDKYRWTMKNKVRRIDCRDILTK